MQLYGRTNFLPPVVKNLILLNVIFFIAKYFLGDWDLDNLLGLHYPTSHYFKPFQFVTYMFMHANLMHILFNMYGLWMFGPILENSLGSQKFMFYYLFTGIGAAIFHLCISYFNIAPFEHALADFINSPNLDQLNVMTQKYIPREAMISINDVPVNVKDHLTSVISQWTNNASNTSQYVKESTEIFNLILSSMTDVPLVGASGALFGILIAFGVLYPMVDLYIFFIPVPIKAKWLVLGYGLIELVMGIVNSKGDDVAHFAHLGGMLFGFILLYYWRKTSNRVW